MNGSRNIFVSSTNQQINSESIEENASSNIYARTFRVNREENASCNIYARTSRTNLDLLQYLNFCWRINITNNGNQILATNDDNNSITSNTNYNSGIDIPDKIESREKF